MPRTTRPPESEEDEDGLTERIIIPISKGMALQIKTFWHDRQFNSKSAAVRHLIEVGLEAENKRARR